MQLQNYELSLKTLCWAIQNRSSTLLSKNIQDCIWCKRTMAHGKRFLLCIALVAVVGCAIRGSLARSLVSLVTVGFMVAISRICPWGGGCSTNQTQAQGLASKDVVRELRTLFGRSHPGAVGQLDDLFFLLPPFFWRGMIVWGFLTTPTWQVVSTRMGEWKPVTWEVRVCDVFCEVSPFLRPLKRVGWGLLESQDFCITNTACSKWVLSLHATTAWVVKAQWITEWTENWQHPHKTLPSFSKEEGGLLPGCLWRRFGSCLFVLWSGFGHLAPEQHRKFFFLWH